MAVEVEVGTVSVGSSVGVGGTGVTDAGGGMVGSSVRVGGSISSAEVQADRKAARVRRSQATGNPVRRLRWSVPAYILISFLTVSFDPRLCVDNSLH